MMSTKTAPFEGRPALVRLFALVCGLLLLTPLVRAADDKAPAGQKYALAIGVNRYEHKDELKQPDLKYADGDAAALAKVLLANGYAKDNVKLLTTENDPKDALSPHGKNIRAELKQLAQKCTESDSILVFYGGYERQFADSDDYFMCPTDGRPGDRATLVSLSEIYKELAGCKAGLKLVVIDSCRAAEKESGQKQPPDGVATLFSCSRGEYANETDELKHGIFSHYVIEALGGAADTNKDGQVTVTELERYVSSRVADYSRSKLKASQKPEMLGDTSRKLPLATVPPR